MNEHERQSHQSDFRYLAPELLSTDIDPYLIAITINNQLYTLGGNHPEFNNEQLIQELLIWAEEKKSQSKLRPEVPKNNLDHTADFLTAYSTFIVDQIDPQIRTVKSAEERRKMFGDSAQANHKCIGEMKALAQLSDDNLYKQQAQRLMQVMGALADRRSAFGRELRWTLNGIKTHVAALNLLEAIGHIIIEVDPENREEVYDWDIDATTDMASLSQGGNWYLINVKSHFLFDNQPAEEPSILPERTLIKHRKLEATTAQRLHKKLYLGNITDEEKERIEGFLSNPNDIEPRRITLNLPYKKGQIGDFGEILDPEMAQKLHPLMP